MELRQLKYFVKIVEIGSMSRASLELSVAQSALSLQIAGLETRVGAKLFLRLPNGVVPTDAGRTLYRHATAILRQVDRAAEEIVSTPLSPSGSVSIGLPAIVFDLIGCELYEQCARDLPLVRLHIADGMSYMLKEMLLHGRIDLAVLYLTGAERGMSVIPLYGESLYLVCPQGVAVGLSRHRTARPDAVAALPLVIPGRGNGVRTAVDDWLDSAGLAPQVNAEIDSLRILKQLAFNGRVCTVLPAGSLQWELRHGAPALVQVHRLDLARDVALCTPDILPLSSAAAAVMAVMRRLVDASMVDAKSFGIRLVPAA